MYQVVGVVWPRGMDRVFKDAGPGMSGVVYRAHRGSHPTTLPKDP